MKKTNTIRERALSDYRLDENNVNLGSPEGAQAHEDSIQTNGLGRSILATADRTIIAGNKTFEKAGEVGAVQRVVEVDVEGDTLVVVRRTDLQSGTPEATRMALADNRTSELQYNPDETLLVELLQGMDGSLVATGYTEIDLAVLLENLNQGSELPIHPEIPESPIGELLKKWSVRRGDLWGAGEHRIMCGDSRDEQDVVRLIGGKAINIGFTSPPYAQQRGYDEDSGFVPVKPDDYVEWFRPVQHFVGQHLAVDGSWFVNIKPACGGLDRELYVFDLVTTHARQWGWHFAEEFCWERRGLPSQVVRRFKNQFEPVYQFTKGEWKIRPSQVTVPSDGVPQALGSGSGDSNAARRQGIINPLEANPLVKGEAYPGNRLSAFNSEMLGHPAAFPVGLPLWFLSAFSDIGDNCYDPFCGSGSTVVAAEESCRIGLGMELSPGYVAISLERLSEMGLHPERIETLTPAL